MTEPTAPEPADTQAPAETPDPFEQVNVSGSTLHIPALGMEVGHGGKVHWHELIAGFERVEHEVEEKIGRRRKPKPTDDRPEPEGEADPGLPAPDASEQDPAAPPSASAAE